MAFKRLTAEGEQFIKYVCTHDSKGNDVSTSNTMLQGNAPLGRVVALPFSSVQNEKPPRIWISKATYEGKLISKNSELPSALISWFNENSEIYGIDANIIAAQAYQESKLKIWIYNPDISSASGISQFIFSTAFEIMIQNSGNSVKFTTDEINILTNGLTDPTNPNYWDVSSSIEKFRTISRSNRTIFFQNEINNPKLMIKAQCRLLKNIQGRNTNLASVALFLYSRGSSVRNQKTYTDAIAEIQRLFSVKYSQEGLNYVQSIFGYLGDRDNRHIKTAKPKGIWFGYNNLYLNVPFNPYNVNVIDSNISYPPVSET